MTFEIASKQLLTWLFRDHENTELDDQENVNVPPGDGAADEAPYNQDGKVLSTPAASDLGP